MRDVKTSGANDGVKFVVGAVFCYDAGGVEMVDRVGDERDVVAFEGFKISGSWGCSSATDCVKNKT